MLFASIIKHNNSRVADKIASRVLVSAVVAPRTPRIMAASRQRKSAGPVPRAFGIP
jgi:hypothetical protein